MELGRRNWSPLSSPSSSPPSSPPSPCSITELFKKKESPAAGLIGILFPPQQPKVVGEHSLLADVDAKIQESLNQTWKTKHGITGNAQRVPQPFYLSSSIFYGGQDDIYPVPESKQEDLTFEDIGVDDLQFASRGDWWQGSLYY